MKANEVWPTKYVLWIYIRFNSLPGTSQLRKLTQLFRLFYCLCFSLANQTLNFPMLEDDDRSLVDHQLLAIFLVDYQLLAGGLEKPVSNGKRPIQKQQSQLCPGECHWASNFV